ncbi:Leucine carboxyl methyltransferase [Carpediemonas membranifera]|uniref:Leucine carboxyl methyltransferase 1 n=1 Tax=Carpediemonas membranifera TaxID=201153 RepID=A0A8J6AUZ7_9EUKA|nr:Leucine carboxyl methyltransferase [Carpediemonas membranifera]|eukprot:KAG9394843.1 Leucine carboxyl methyltransferase [Carpediemonas membranifera]
MTQDMECSAQSVIQSTAMDALNGKIACVQAGYYDDRFIQAFSSSMVPQHSILMKRGYTARVYAFEQAVRRFIATFPDSQIISLGAGFDTLAFRLAEANAPMRRYVEVDLPSTVNTKTALMARRRQFVGVVDPSVYEIVSVDLLDPDAPALLAATVDPALPTLFIAECLFAYLPIDATDALLSGLAERFTGTRALMTYDPVNPLDRYGEAMLANLRRFKNIHMPGVVGAPTIEALTARYTRLGFPSVGRTMLNVYDEVIPEAERRRLAHLEFLDEYEEWNLLLGHYCITLSGVDAEGDSAAIHGLLEGEWLVPEKAAPERRRVTPALFDAIRE